MTFTKWLDEKRIVYQVSADGLIYVDGNLTILEKENIDAENLFEVSGYVDVSENATFTAPALAKSGSVYVRANATFTAPALVEVSGYVDVSENATFTAPALVTIGHLAYETEIFGHSVKVFDGIGCVILSEKTRDNISIKSCRKAAFKDGELIGEKFFVVSKDGNNSHGETLEDALSDLMFKTADRDVSKFRNMPLDTTKSPQDWSVVYRIITGACQYGTQRFIKNQGDIKEQYTLTEIINLTRGAWGFEKFISVINPNYKEVA